MHESAAMYLNLSGRIPTVAAQGDPKNASALKKAAEEFEAVFINQLLKVMRETIEESGLTGEGCGKSIYTELFDQEISLSMARRGMLGISDMITRDLAADWSEGGIPVHTTNTQAPVPVEIDPAAGPRTRDTRPAVHPQTVLAEVREFVSLARSGAYMAGDRRVHRTERSRWRLTFRRLFAASRQALHAQDIAPGATALASLIDLAC